MKFTKMIVLICTFALSEGNVPKPTMTRTELRVAKSIDPEETQTLNVMTRDGNVAQLVVKRRDSRRQIFPPHDENESLIRSPPHTRSLRYDWFPAASAFLRTDSFSYDRNISDASVISHDRTLQIPKPVTVRSGDVFVKQTKDYKKGRSLVEIDYDGIPVVQGVRVPDDESDKKIWRNARVINGELVPYEDGYKPPVAVPVGQLVYASTTRRDPDSTQGIGPFTTSDNYNDLEKTEKIYGPFSVKDNIAKSGKSKGVGPFSVSDMKLAEYIKEINKHEFKKDYSKRQLRSYGSEDAPQIQRRMLHHDSYPQNTNSLAYISQSGHVNFNEGVRTPILQYAHPELGVQPAKASSEREFSFDDEIERHSQPPYYSNSINNIDYYKRDVMNYPYTGYYIKPQTEQPLWIKITESIKNNVQNGFERMHQLTRPVIEPIVEVTNKIGHTLGLAPVSQPEEKIGFIAPIAGSSAILPALGLVAGGAALGLGAAAMGRYLHPELGMRLMPDNNILLIMQDPTYRNEANHQRYKRSANVFDDHYVQQISSIIENTNLHELRSSRIWEDTPCSKRATCEVLVKQNPDEIIVMEKKMGSLFFSSQSDVLRGIAYHMEEVLEAAKTGDCSRFVCVRQLPVVLV